MNFQSLVELAPWTTIAQICNLLIQIVLFKKFLFQPIKNIIAKRQAEVDGLYDEAGKAKADAEGTYGLVVELKEVASDQPAGTVVEQSIAPNTEVPKGSTIVFSVSAAPAVKETTVDIPLPDDRSTVELIVELDGVEFFNDTVDCSLGHISVKLTSTQDTGYLSYYYDGALQSQFSVSFTG